MAGLFDGLNPEGIRDLVGRFAEAAVRKVISKQMPLFVRISATDWVEGVESW